MRRLFAAALLAALAQSAATALAQQDPPDAGRTWASCTEHVPPGATRPEIKEVFPGTGFSGYAESLEITVT
ncbi:MAG TPA: hypothetical protein VLS89_20480, partial [Candidatus Nanopelagicales bacterium]|nr:hypothetical protein [Candidatus Nanopelagicales bacterium]